MPFIAVPSVRGERCVPVFCLPSQGRWPEGPEGSRRIQSTPQSPAGTAPLERGACPFLWKKRSDFDKNPAGKVLQTAVRNGGKLRGEFKKFSTFPVEFTHSFPQLSNRAKRAVWNPQIFHAFSKRRDMLKASAESAFVRVFNFFAAPTAATMLISLVTCIF